MEGNSQANRVSSSKQKHKHNTQRVPNRTNGYQRSRKPKTSTTCFNCGEEYPHTDRSCPASGRKCYKCGHDGHYAKCCKPDRQKGPRHNNNPSSNKRKQQHHAAAHNVHDDDLSDSDREYTLAVQSDGKVPKIKVKVDTKPIEFVIDSGASVNIIDELTYRKLGVPLSESKIKLYAYGAKKPLCVIGKMS